MLTWDDSYNVGSLEFDDHHHKLFEILNGLMSSLEKGSADEATVVGALTKLLDYTEYHFKAEEELLRKNAYPDLEKQEEEHKDFIASLNVFKASYEYGVVPPVEDLVRFLTKWLAGHIRVCDKAYAAFLAEKGIR
jgi:hemerythrin